MMPILLGVLSQVILGTLLFLTAFFLVLLVLVQRGRGGGLTGALGGIGGQSAFGTKAGDVFTRITIGAAVFWIFLCMLTIILLSGSEGFAPSGRRPVTGGAGDTAPDAATLEAPDSEAGGAAGDDARLGADAEDPSPAGAGADASGTSPAGAATSPAGEAPRDESSSAPAGNTQSPADE